MLANHKEHTVSVRGNLIHIKRGQIGHGERDLAKRWMWSQKKVANFKKLLEKESQIDIIKTSSLSIISILKYQQYQSEESQKSHRRVTGESQKSQNKNEKNVKNEKNPPTPRKGGRSKITIEGDPAYFDENVKIWRVKTHEGVWKNYVGSEKPKYI